ncbi:MAG: hypothetical protein HQK49_12665 [Oligoflexia bacterium]|nr:hypothetical protein [Oligoflexia bacterium]
MKTKRKKEIKLDKYEKQIEKDRLAGSFKNINEENSVIKKLQSMAKEQIKEKRINLRMNADDLKYFEMEAKRMGMAYQTLIGSVLHRYIHNQLIDVKEINKVTRKKVS